MAEINAIAIECKPRQASAAGSAVCIHAGKNETDFQC